MHDTLLGRAVGEERIAHYLGDLAARGVIVGLESVVGVAADHALAGQAMHMAIVGAAGGHIRVLDAGQDDHSEMESRAAEG